MNYVTLGKTGLKAAVVSFGGIPIQRADGANTKAVVDKLEEYGINYIDTARGYTVSEEYLGAALEGRRDTGETTNRVFALQALYRQTRAGASV